jgi:hypothetical protein
MAQATAPILDSTPDDLQSHALKEAEQQKVRNAVGSCGVEFSWLRAGHRHELIN